MSHKSEMAGPFNRGDTIINKHTKKNKMRRPVSHAGHEACCLFLT